jgi:heme-binding NEAT domain protein
MFEVNKPKPKPVVVIRAATGQELSEYEKYKLASIEENAQENKIEAVSININGNTQRIDPLNKEIQINLGSLALSSHITPSDISNEDLFVIQCELDNAELL